MRLVVVGAGYVGLVTGTGLSDLGHDVLVYDIDPGKIAALRDGRIPIYEPGLADLVHRNQRNGRLTFATSIGGYAQCQADAYFIAVGTPPSPDGSADLSAIYAAAGRIRDVADREQTAVVVMKSTVPVGTCDAIQGFLNGGPAKLEVVSNPEFLKEGDAVNDFFRPDRVVVGARSPSAHALMRELYAPLQLCGDRLLATDPRSSELVKYASNAMLATRISFMNELSRLCHATGADIHAVRLGVGSDSRIGNRFLYAGPGYGGSCLHGRETAIVRHSGRVRLVALAKLFREFAEDADARDALWLAPAGLEVLALAPGEGAPRFFPCRALTRRPFEGAAVRVRTKMGRRVTCTPDHPFVVVDPDTGARSVKLAKDLTDRDWLPIAMAPDGIDRSSGSIDLLGLLEQMGIDESEVIVRLDEPDRATLARMTHDEVFDAIKHPRGRERVYDVKRKGALRLDEARQLGLALNDPMLGTARNGTYTPRRIPLDEHFWRVVGLYLAEGHCTADGRRRRLGWSFHPHNEEALVEEVASFWRGLGVSCDVYSKPTARAVTVSSRLLAGLFVDVLRLGSNSYDVRLPDIAWTQPASHQMALLSGAWHGDGSWSLCCGGPSVRLDYGTVSRELADGMSRMLAWNGIVSRIHSGRMAKSTCDAWFLSISGAAQIERAIELVKECDRAEVLESIARQQKRIAPTGYRPMTEGASAVRVLAKAESFYRGHVYSMEVDDAETIVTSDGLVVHNCFPKDVQALAALGRQHGVELEVTEAAHRANEKQGAFVADLLEKSLGGLDGVRVALWGCAFKPDTDDIREAPAVKLTEALLARGASVVAHDPEAAANFERHFGKAVSTRERHYDVLDGAHALVLLTEWRCYRAPDFAEMRRRMGGPAPLVLDARNIWKASDVARAGLRYRGIGVPDAGPVASALDDVA